MILIDHDLAYLTGLDLTPEPVLQARLVERFGSTGLVGEVYVADEAGQPVDFLHHPEDGCHSYDRNGRCWIPLRDGLELLSASWTPLGAWSTRVVDTLTVHSVDVRRT